MTSYLSSLQFPSFSLSSSAAPPADDAADAPPAPAPSAADPAGDAPLHALPSAERAALTELRALARPVLAEHGPQLPAGDSFAQPLGEASATDATDAADAAAGDAPGNAHLDAALLRLLRHHALSVARADKHLRKIVAWRVSSRIADADPETRRAAGCGLPVAELSATRDGRELLCFSAGDRYDRRAVVRATQSLAVEKMFDYLMYDARGPRATRCTIVVDFKDFGTKNVDLVGTKLGIMTYLNYFPDLLTRVLLVNYPRIVYGVWRAVRPLLDARTAASVQFVPSVAELHAILADVFDEDLRPSWLGGTAPPAPVELYNGDVLQPDELAARFPLE